MSLTWKTTKTHQTKVLDEEKGIVGAFVSVIGNKDSVNDIIQPGAFDDYLKVRKPKGVWSHDWDKPISKTLDIFEMKAGDPRLPVDLQAAGLGALYVETQFNLKTQMGRDAFENVKFYDDEAEWSIGYVTHEEKYDTKQKANLLYKIELFEYSPVLFGANPLTSTASIKAQFLEGKMEIEIEGIEEKQIDAVREAVLGVLEKDAEDVETDETEVDEKDDDQEVEAKEVASEEEEEVADAVETSEDDTDVEGKSDETEDEDDETSDDEKDDETEEGEKSAGVVPAKKSPRHHNVKDVSETIELKAIPGSFEERYSLIDKALYDEYSEVGYAYVYATFEDKIIFYLYDRNSGEHDYWQASYSIDSEKKVTFGEPVKVDVVEVVVLKSLLSELDSFGMLSDVKDLVSNFFDTSNDEEVVESEVKEIETETEVKETETEVEVKLDEATDEVEEKTSDETAVVDADFIKSIAGFYSIVQEIRSTP